MKWFLRQRVPPVTRLLLVESGPRQHSLRLIPRLRESVCGDAPIDLFTCLPDEPTGLGPEVRAWRTYEVANHAERWRLLRQVRRQGYSAAAVLCSGSPLLGVWKLVLAALLPAKLLLVDDRGRFFWLDRRHWREALALGISRSGVRNPEFVRKVSHALLLPFSLCILIPYAAKVHLGRLARAVARGSAAD